MADEAAEAAFLDAMRAQNDAAGGQEVNGITSQQQTDSVSDDEYDPAAVLPAESLSPDAQDPAVHIFSTSSTSAVKPAISSASQEPHLATTVSAYDDAQGSDQSRSMSPDSTQSVPGSPPIISQTKGESMNEPPGLDATTDSPGVEQGTITNGQHRDQASPTIPNTLPNSISTDHVSIQNNVQGVPSAESVQNSVAPSISNVPAPATDIEATSDGKSVAEASTSAPQSQPKAKTETAPASTASVPKARLPHDRIGILEDRIQADPRGDTDAWLALISEHRQRGKVNDARKTYDRFFEVFPSAAEIWAAYAKMENESQERQKLEQIFSKTLPNIPHLQLWSMYIDHIRRVNNLATDTNGEARKTISQAYEATLQHVGLDKEAGKLWQDHIQFLKSGPGVVGGSSWQDQQKMDGLRKAYRQAICVPNQAVGTLWKEYDVFENGLNKVTARKFLNEISPSFVTARSSNVQLQNITRNLRRNTVPVLPPAPGCEGYEQYMEQLGIWKQWIEWEIGDPLVFRKNNDFDAYRARVLFVYKQALISLRFWPEIWFEAVEFCFSNDLDEIGNDLLNKGIEANPESCLLTFKKADRYELATAGEEGDPAARRRGKAIKGIYKVLLDSLYEAMAKEKSREAQELAQIEAQYASQAQQSIEKADDGEEEPNQEEISELEQRKAQHIDGARRSSAAYTHMLKKTVTFSWIALMRSMRRVQGKGRPKDDELGGSRMVFGDARKRGQVTTDLYIESAYIEFHCYEPEATRKIFERGLKLYPDDEQFALEYIRHLTNNSEHTNARVIFETIVSKLLAKPETRAKAKPLFAFFHDFESRYGELTGIMKLEARMRENFPEDPTLSLFSRRFIAPEFDPRAVRVIVSPAAQTRPKAFSVPSIEAPLAFQDTPPKPVIQTGNSPKRPLPSEDSDNEGGRPRKVARAESPLPKGAAGRRVEQRRAQRNETPHVDGATSNHVPPPPSLHPNLNFFLQILPKAQLFNDSEMTPIIPAKAVRFLQDTYVPSDFAEYERWKKSRPAMSGIPQPPQPPHHLQQPPPLPQHMGYGQPANQGHYMPPMPSMPPQPHAQYNGGYPVFPSQSIPPPDPRNGLMHNGGGNDSRNGYGQGFVSHPKTPSLGDPRGPPSATANPPPSLNMSSQNPFGEQPLTTEQFSAIIEEQKQRLAFHSAILEQHPFLR